ncbi:MAG: hypothetical protein HFJ12_01765 [Bacilli bacterium]|nr:hypothetical protein [Bacilli bacterium]
MKKSTRITVLIMVVIVLLTGLFFLTIGQHLIKREKEENIILVGNGAIFHKNGTEWNHVSFEDINLYNWKEYYTYIDHSYYGNYNLYFNEKWYLFKGKNQAVNYEGDLLALRGNIKYKVVDFTLYDIEDFTDAKRVLKENNLPVDSVLTSSYYINTDIDNDGNKEIIYTISNKFPMEDVGDTSFSFIFMVKDNRVIYLYKNIEPLNDVYSGCQPYINNLIDINEDNHYEIIVGCSYYSNNGVKYGMYEFTGDKFKLLVSN